MPFPIFSIILYFLIIIFALASTCVSMTVFYTLLSRWSMVRRYRTDFLLIFNSYLTLFIVGPLFTDMAVRSILGYFHSSRSLEDFQCRFKAYLMYIQGCVYFYSFLLQSIYRFCRIVYYARPELHSFGSYRLASLLIWINAFLQLLPCFLLRSIDYVSTEHHCQFPPSDLLGSLVGLSILFLTPYLLTLICYIGSLSYVHKRSAMLIGSHRRLRVRRDLLIFRRLVLLLTVVALVAMPHMILPIIYALFGTLPSWSTAFVWLMTVIALTSVAIIQIFISPVFKRLFFGKERQRSLVAG